MCLVDHFILENIPFIFSSLSFCDSCLKARLENRTLAPKTFFFILPTFYNLHTRSLSLFHTLKIQIRFLFFHVVEKSKEIQICAMQDAAYQNIKDYIRSLQRIMMQKGIGMQNCNIFSWKFHVWRNLTIFFHPHKKMLFNCIFFEFLTIFSANT